MTDCDVTAMTALLVVTCWRRRCRQRHCASSAALLAALPAPLRTTPLRYGSCGRSLWVARRFPAKPHLTRRCHLHFHWLHEDRNAYERRLLTLFVLLFALGSARLVDERKWLACGWNWLAAPT